MKSIINMAKKIVRKFDYFFAIVKFIYSMTISVLESNVKNISTKLQLVLKKFTKKPKGSATISKASASTDQVVLHSSLTCKFTYCASFLVLLTRRRPGLRSVSASLPLTSRVSDNLLKHLLIPDLKLFWFYMSFPEISRLKIQAKHHTTILLSGFPPG